MSDTQPEAPERVSKTAQDLELGDRIVASALGIGTIVALAPLAIGDADPIAIALVLDSPRETDADVALTVGMLLADLVVEVSTDTTNPAS